VNASRAAAVAGLGLAHLHPGYEIDALPGELLFDRAASRGAKRLDGPRLRGQKKDLALWLGAPRRQAGDERELVGVDRPRRARGTMNATL
jgi:hypothetical protein